MQYQSTSKIQISASSIQGKLKNVVWHQKMHRSNYKQERTIIILEDSPLDAVLLAPGFAEAAVVPDHGYHLLKCRLFTVKPKLDQI